MTTARIVRYDGGGFQVFLDTNGTEIEVELVKEIDITADNAQLKSVSMEFQLTETVKVERKPALKIGKRYLTRDWEVVKYDGTQDVVARVWRNKPGRFEPDDMVLGKQINGGAYFNFHPDSAKNYMDNLWYLARVSDLPGDMKQRKR